jgi:WD40 repeat protein
MKPSQKQVLFDVLIIGLILVLCALSIFIVMRMLRGFFSQDTQGPIMKRYELYQKALHDNNLSELKKILTKNKQKENAEIILTSLKTASPEKIDVQGIEIKGKQATFHLKGVKSGQTVNGTLTFIKEDGEWKVSSENWTPGAQDKNLAKAQTPGVARPQIPFFDDPAKPPQQRFQLSGHQDAISSLAFTPDSQYLLSTSGDDLAIKSWNTFTGKEVSQAKSDKRVAAVGVAPDGKKMLTADGSNQITIWTLANGTIGAKINSLQTVGDSFALSKDGKWLGTVGVKFSIKIWQLQDSSPIETVKKSKNQRALVFSPNRESLLSADDKGYTVWNTNDWKGKRYNIDKTQGQVASMDIRPDGKRLAIGHDDSGSVIVDLENNKEINRLTVQGASTASVRFSPDGKLLATANKNTVYLWSADTGAQLAQLNGHSADVTSLAFSPDGNALASGGKDKKIIIWQGGLKPAVKRSAQ